MNYSLCPDLCVDADVVTATSPQNPCQYCTDPICADGADLFTHDWPTT